MLTFLLILSFYSFIYILIMYFFAKRFGVNVEKVFLWYDPWFSLYKTKWNETEFGLGWLPLGSYLKMSGMLTEEGYELKPDDFNAKGFFERVLIIASGPLFCLIPALTWYIYSQDLEPQGIDDFIIYLMLSIMVFLFFFGVLPTLIPRKKQIQGTSTLWSVLVFLILMGIYVFFILHFYYHLNKLIPLHATTAELLGGDYKLHHLTKDFTIATANNLMVYTGIYLFFMNLLPLGTLNGFKILETSYEAYLGKKLPDKLLEYYAVLSMLIVLGVWIYLLVNLFL